MDNGDNALTMMQSAVTVVHCAREATWCLLSSLSRALQHLPDQFDLPRAAFLLGFGQCFELLMHDRIDDPMWRVGRPWCRGSYYPAECFHLLKQLFDIAPPEFGKMAHAPSAALDIAVGDAFSARGQGCIRRRRPSRRGRSRAPARPHRTPGRGAAGTHAGSRRRVAPWLR